MEGHTHLNSFYADPPLIGGRVQVLQDFLKNWNFYLQNIFIGLLQIVKYFWSVHLGGGLSVAQDLLKSFRAKSVPEKQEMVQKTSTWHRRKVFGNEDGFKLYIDTAANTNAIMMMTMMTRVMMVVMMTMMVMMVVMMTMPQKLGTWVWCLLEAVWTEMHWWCCTQRTLGSWSGVGKILLIMTWWGLWLWCRK